MFVKTLLADSDARCLIVASQFFSWIFVLPESSLRCVQLRYSNYAVMMSAMILGWLILRRVC